MAFMLIIALLIVKISKRYDYCIEPFLNISRTMEILLYNKFPVRYDLVVDDYIM